MVDKKAKSTDLIKAKMIAPCGMNCALCSGFLREKNICSGCRIKDPNKPNYCLNCYIVNCETINKDGKKYCFSCTDFPCKRMKDLDKRYRTKYGMSMIENLKFIKEHGIRKFIANEKERWECKNCGAVTCVHKDNCIFCVQKWDKQEL